MEVNYTAFGVKIAGISSKKLGDDNEGILQNNYQFQGDFSEMDEDIGWNDFELRNYDPQIGRWIQQDPYDEFPSPYIGIGNDPINYSDPSGGSIASSIFSDMSGVTRLGVTTLLGAIIGGAVDGLTGGDGFNGALLGAGIGLLSNINFKAVTEHVGELSKGVPFIAQVAAPTVSNTINRPSINPPVIETKLVETQSIITPKSIATPIAKKSALIEEDNQKPETPWLKTARSQFGVGEKTNNNDGPDVDRYLKTVGLAGTGQPWCGAFVNWTLKQNGIKGVPITRETHPARALDWRKWGQSLHNPALGSMATLKRPGGGHVGLTVATDADRPGWIIILGGNQSDHVNYRSFPKKILKFNYPQNFTPSYKLPSMSGIKKGIKMQ